MNVCGFILERFSISADLFPAFLRQTALSSCRLHNHALWVFLPSDRSVWMVRPRNLDVEKMKGARPVRQSHLPRALSLLSIEVCQIQRAASEQVRRVSSHCERKQWRLHSKKLMKPGGNLHITDKHQSCSSSLALSSICLSLHLHLSLSRRRQAGDERYRTHQKGAGLFPPSPISYV